MVCFSIIIITHLLLASKLFRFSLSSGLSSARSSGSAEGSDTLVQYTLYNIQTTQTPAPPHHSPPGPRPLVALGRYPRRQEVGVQRLVVLRVRLVRLTTITSDPCYSYTLISLRSAVHTSKGVFGSSIFMNP